LLASTVLHSLQAQEPVHTEGNGHGGQPATPVIAVTSAVRSEGKSVVSANLAAAFGELGLKAIVISCDLRAPTLHRYFDVPTSPGIVDAVEDWDGKPGFHRILLPTRAQDVSLIPAGSATPRPAAVLAREEFRSICRYAQEEAQIVILDTPAIMLSGDALQPVQAADAILLVTRAGRTSLDAAERVSETLDRLGANVIGYAFNGSQGVTAGRQGPYRISREARPVTVPDLASTGGEGRG